MKIQRELVIIPEGVQVIEHEAFNLNNFKVVQIPSTIKTLYKESFNSAYYLEKVINKSNKNLKSYFSSGITIEKG